MQRRHTRLITSSERRDRFDSISRYQMKVTNPSIYKWAQRIAHKVASRNKEEFRMVHGDYYDDSDLESWAWLIGGDY